MIMVDMDDSCVQDTEACILQAQEALSCNARSTGIQYKERQQVNRFIHACTINVVVVEIL